METDAGYAWGDTLPTLTTARVVLRPIETSDAAAYFAIFSDAETTLYWSRPPMQQLAEAEAYVAHVIDAFRTRRAFQWAIAQPGDPTLIGHCALHRVDLDHRRAEVGFVLSRSLWGSGLMSRALAMLVAFAFESMQLHRLEADVDPRNARSLALLARHGFRQEGLMRQRYWVNGEWQDTAMLALLRPEWAARQ